MANYVTLYWEAGCMESLLWVDSSKSYGRLLRGKEADGADGATVAEHKPKRRVMGAGPAWHRVREEEGAEFGSISLSIPAGEATLFSCTCSPPGMGPRVRSTGGSP